MKDPVFLITGANGQIGNVLTARLRDRFGKGNVIASDLREADHGDGPFEVIDIMDSARIKNVVEEYGVTRIYHLAALLSSKGEDNPGLTWDINLDAWLNLLEISKDKGIERIFFPSTIGIYGPTTPRIHTPQNASFLPTTVYGISKITGELWGQYYRKRHGLDVRGIRYPGVISYESIPSGGTTDFAVEMFFAALDKGHYKCYLKPETRLPMVYMPDVIKGTLQLMDADISKISIATSYNLSAFSLSPRELYEAIKNKVPGFSITYEPDNRQEIADSWSESIDDSLARKDWGWEPEYEMEAMVDDMIKNVGLRVKS